MPVYARTDLAFERGDGCWLVAENGDRYLDFGAGVAVNLLGHAHPHLVETVREQSGKLWHTSNLFRIPSGERLAERLCANTFADFVFFTNSGAEAIETAVKVARKYQSADGRPERFRIITFEGAFHGRTLAAIAAGGQKKYLDGFGPPVEGFDQVPFGDLEAVEAAIGPQTAGVLLEPIQGEGGIRVFPPAFLRALRALCDEHGLMLILDEIQCGMGRSGRLFVHETAGIEPDIMAVAKGLGGGFPIGACLATAEAAKGMTLGAHGNTFGGNPLATTVGNAVLDIVLADGFLQRVRDGSLRLKQKLARLLDTYPAVVAEVRGEGLMLGLRCLLPMPQVVAALREEKLIAIPAGDNVVRLLPPLIVSDAEIDDAVERLDRALGRLDAGLRSEALARAAE